MEGGRPAGPPDIPDIPDIRRERTLNIDSVEGERIVFIEAFIEIDMFI